VFSTASSILTILSTLIVTIALPLLSFLGVQKFIIEPRYEARRSKSKYATALYFACKELKVHLENASERLKAEDSRIGDAMKKIPDRDFHGNPAWFTKDGYYATITAHKIATVSAWLRIYQNALLFSLYAENQRFLRELYEKAQQLKVAFSTDTCLWYYYFDAVGERLITESESGASALTFSKFCAQYANDSDFRKFFDQLHMYIWFVGNKDPKYIHTLPKIRQCLEELISLLEQKNLLPGFPVQRPATAVGELDKAPERAGA
jgi:hypothetical protein